MTPTNRPSATAAIRAFMLVELFIVIVVLALLAMVLIPAWNDAGKKAERISCVSNLKLIALSFRVSSGSNTISPYPMSVSTNDGGTREFIASGEAFRYFQVMSNELVSPQVLVCPSDRERRAARDFGPAFSNTNVSYFVGLDANEAVPDLFLAGDRNLTLGGVPVKSGSIVTLTSTSAVGWSAAMHRNLGNVALSDGSVNGYASANLPTVLAGIGPATNRLVIP